MRQEIDVDEFFSYVSKGVIIFPIAIIILGLIFRFNKTEKNQVYQTPTIIITPTNSIVPTENKIPFDLIGPWVCNYKTNNEEYILNVKNKKISLEIKTDGQTKKYDLSQYAGLLENFLNLDINQLESMAKPYLPKGVDLKTLLESCKKGS
jgi:hypothetical protein